MRPLLTLIIPVYNTEKYLDKLLPKLNGQINDLVQVILIDDGSTDSSLEICNKFSSINSNFTVIHQENKGASAARNNGIRNAKGEYMAFLDSDDMITDNYIEVVCRLCKESRADIIQLDHYCGSPETGYFLKKNQLPQGLIPYEIFCKFLLEQKSNLLWNKIFKSSCIIENEIYFDDSMIMGEDISFTLEVMKYSNIIQVEHEAVYYYLNNRSGLCANVKTNYLNDLDKLYSNMKNFVEFKRLGPEAIQIVQESMVNSVFRAIGLCINNGSSINDIDRVFDSLENLKYLNKVHCIKVGNKLRQYLLKKRFYKIIAKFIALKHSN